MERLLKELLLERQKLEQLKSDVNNMEYDALQRRFRRVNSTSLIPRVSKDTFLSAHWIRRVRAGFSPLEGSKFDTLVNDNLTANCLSACFHLLQTGLRLCSRCSLKR